MDSSVHIVSAFVRGQIRLLVAGVVTLVIAVASIVEPPGAIESVGFAVVIVAMMLVVLQEMRKHRQR